VSDPPGSRVGADALITAEVIAELPTRHHCSRLFIRSTHPRSVATPLVGAGGLRALPRSDLSVSRLRSPSHGLRCRPHNPARYRRSHPCLQPL